MKKKKMKHIDLETLMQFCAFAKTWPAPIALENGTVFTKDQRKFMKAGLGLLPEIAAFWCIVRNGDLTPREKLNEEMKTGMAEVWDQIHEVTTAKSSPG